MREPLSIRESARWYDWADNNPGASTMYTKSCVLCNKSFPGNYRIDHCRECVKKHQTKQSK